MKIKSIKIIFLALLGVLLCGALSVGAALAVNADSTEIGKASVESKSAYRGDTVTIDVSFDYNPGIQGTRLSLTYDDGLELTAATNTGLLTGSCTFSDNINRDPYLMLWDDYTASTNNYSTGVVVTLTFKVKDDAVFGVQNIYVDVEEDNTLNYDLDNVYFEVTNGSITVLCNHSYSEWTSSGSGQHTHICSICGETETENCTYNGVVTTAATCTADGVKTYTCEYCGDSHTEVISATGHTSAAAVKENVVEATCTAGGSYDSVVYCATCGVELSRETITVEATGHSVVQVQAQAATCTEAGWNAYEYCTKCDYTTYSEIAATGHSLVQVEAQAATCTEAGWNAYEYCSVCGYTTYKEIPATGHSYVMEVIAEPTYETTGLYQYTCSVCGDTYTKEIAVLGHTHEYESIVTKEATCTEDGIMTYVCSLCQDTYTETIPAAGHTSSDWIVDKEAEVGVAGHQYKECTVCGEVLEEEEIPALTESSSDDDSEDTASSGSDSSGNSSSDSQASGCAGVIGSDSGSGNILLLAISMISLCAAYVVIRLHRKNNLKF